MALQGNLELDEEILEGVYFKIQKIQTAAEDYEFFENVNDPKHPDIAQRLTWIKRYQNSATFYVWGSEEARKNNARPIHWFPFEFKFDINSQKNIYSQAYEEYMKVNTTTIEA